MTHMNEEKKKKKKRRGCPVTFAGNAQSDCVCEIRKKTNPAARDTNRGWEPPLTVYPRGQGDIPQHL